VRQQFSKMNRHVVVENSRLVRIWTVPPLHLQKGGNFLEKKTILIDIDDTVLYDFELPFINEFFGTKYSYADFEYVNAYVQR